MEEEMLISAVEKYKELYDPGNQYYLDAKRKENIWEEIGREIQKSGEECKILWTKVRTNYRKALKWRQKKSGQASLSNKPIRFEKELEFLQPFLRMRGSSPNYHSGEEDDEAPERDPLKETRKRSWDECSYCEETSLQLESERAKYIKEQDKQNKYGDKQFLDSLLPFLNDIPKNRKLFVRTKIMEVLMEELNRQESSSQHLSHTFTPYKAFSTPRTTILPDIHENSADGLV